MNEWRAETNALNICSLVIGLVRLSSLSIEMDLNIISLEVPKQGYLDYWIAMKRKQWFLR